MDDCSPDNSIEVLQKLVQSCDTSGKEIIILRHETNKGQGGARNTGVQAATGDYLMFVDSDDEITVDCVEKLLRFSVANNADVTTANSVMINPYTKEKYYKPNIYKETNLYIGKEILDKFPEYEVTLWNNLFRLKSFTHGELNQVEGMYF